MKRLRECKHIEIIAKVQYKSTQDWLWHIAKPMEWYGLLKWKNRISDAISVLIWKAVSLKFHNSPKQKKVPTCMG
jgi:hypothetical protein